ncbi:MAG: hypothetical protein ACRCUY_11990 [Thermoguttaceae bacterium]
MQGDGDFSPRTGGVLFHAIFDPITESKNGNDWPDDWTRVAGIDKGVSFPAYIPISITENPNPFSNHSLRMKIRGGAAAAMSPKIPIAPGMSYGASVYVDAEGMDDVTASMVLLFYSEKQTTPIHTVRSEKVKDTNGWLHLTIDPIVANMPGVAFASIGLVVLPELRQDYNATVDFTNVELLERPTVSLSMSQQNHLVFDPHQISVSCAITGIDPTQEVISFQLESPNGRVIAKRDIEMVVANKPASQFIVPKKHSTTPVYSATAIWKDIPVNSPGFYRVRLVTPEQYAQKTKQKMIKGSEFVDPLRFSAHLSFVVMTPGDFIPDGEFGWNLANWSLDEIKNRNELLRQSAISRLKIPAWFINGSESSNSMSTNAESTNAGSTNSETENFGVTNFGSNQQLLDLAIQLSQQNVKLVGVLDPIPALIRSKIRVGPVNAASIFSLAPEMWTDSLQPLLQDASFLIKDWQWTSDDDLTINEVPNFAQKFDAMRKSFDRNNLGFGIGFAWNWILSFPDTIFSSLGDGATQQEIEASDLAAGILQPANQYRFNNVEGFLALSSPETLTPEELGCYLDATGTKNIRRFVSITPLSSSEYGHEERISDLVRRMVFAKIHGANGVFLSNPISKKSGVLHSDTTPTELYLPWRVTSQMISGKRFLGSITLPNRSRNFIFESENGRAVMVVWNDAGTDNSPVLEMLILGADAKVVDVWGKETELAAQEARQVISVSSIPIFVSDIDLDIAKLRIGFELETTHRSSVINSPVPITFSFQNDAMTPISASVTIIPPRPESWKMTPQKVGLTLSPGIRQSGTFDVSLTNSANTGVQKFRFDVKTEGVRNLQFDVYAQMHIGNPDLRLEFSSRLMRNGDIELIQAFINDGETPFTYICRLIAGQRAFQQVILRDVGFGRKESVYTIKDGRKLVEQGVKEITIRAQTAAGTTQGEPMTYTIPLLNP